MKDKYTVLVLKNCDPRNHEEVIRPENVDLISINAENIIVATSDGKTREDGTIGIQAHVTGENYEVISRMFMLLASKTHKEFIESKNIKEKKK